MEILLRQLNAMTIQNDGNVGIGTAAPDLMATSGMPNVFTVFGSTGGSDIASIELASRAASSAYTVASINFFNSEAAGNRLLATISALTADAGESYATQSGDLAFYTTTTASDGGGVSTERMRIDSEGNIGIGTAAPGVLLQLGASEIGGNARHFTSYGITGAEGSLDYSMTLADNTAIAVGTGAGIRFGGRWNTTAGDNAGGGGIDIYKETVTSGEYGFALRFHARANGASLTEKMRITGAGKVGIGTTAPEANQALTVTGSVIGSAGAYLGNVSFMDDSSLAANTGGGILFGGAWLSEGDITSWAAITGLKENATCANYDAALVFNTRTTSGGWSENMRIASSGYVGIGTTAPDSTLHVFTASAGSITPDTDADDLVVENSGRAGISILSPDASSGKLIFGTPSDAVGAHIGWNHNSDLMTVGTSNSGASLAFYSDNNAEAVRIDSSGNVGIGTDNPGFKLDIRDTGDTVQSISSYSTTDAENALISLQKSANATVGTLAETADGEVLGGVHFAGVNSSNTSSGAGRIQWEQDGAAGATFIPGRMVFKFATASAGVTERMRIDSGGCVGIGTAAPGQLLQVQGGTCIAGALSKASGSFNIEHPLESKKDTHNLVHSFIEGPQADLIYSGIVQLINGTVQVNIDIEAGMTDGTFVALNTCVRAFTSNETNWDAVRGSITGNVLTIESNVSTSAACVSWMVIGERQDPHMKSTDWTDDNGKVIVEPLKS